MIAVEPSKEYIDYLWFKLKDTKGSWSQLEGSDYRHFYASYMKSNLLVYFGFGVGRVTHLEKGHSCRVHGCFWSKEAYSKGSDVRVALGLVAKTFLLRRIECVVPSDVRSIAKYVERVGFSFEGRMASWYKGKERFFDGDRYAIIF